MASPKLNVHIHKSEHSTRGAVVLLHGLGSSGEDWPLQVQALVEHHAVYAVDLPGHGDSEAIAGWPGIPDYACALADWIQAAALECVHVAGLSLGGLVALQLGVDYPELIKSLTVVNAFSRMRVGVRGGLHSVGRLMLLVFGRMDWLGAWVAGALFPEEGQEQLRQMAAARIAANPRKSYLQSALAIARFDLDGRLDEIRCPTLIVAGGRDLIIPLDAKKQLAEQIPNARYTLMPASGHVTPIDAGERFNELLVDFLRASD